MKESLKGFSWVGNFPFWVGKFGKYFLTCNDLDGFVGFQSLTPENTLISPVTFILGTPLGYTCMYLKQP